MKKVILFLSTLVLFLNSVKAEEYSNWVESLDENTKYDEIQEEKRYRFYKEEIIGEYLVSDTLNNYNYNDQNNYIYSDFSKWQDTCEVKDGNVETKDFYPYKNLIVDSNYIIIDEINGEISFNDIKIFSNEEEINFEIEECDNCVSDFSKISKEEKLILKLEKNIPSKTITFYLDASDKYPNVTYKLKTTYDKEGTKIAIVKIANSNLKDFIPNDRWFYLAMESDIMYSETPVLEDNNTVIFPIKNMCRYQEKMTYFYNINRTYYDNNYYTNVDGYIKDINDYKVYYRYLINKDNAVVIEESNNNITNSTYSNESEPTKESINIETIDNNNLQETTIADKEINNKQTPLVNTMSINKKVPIIKYIILLVIILTLIFIFYQNKKYNKKMSLK